MKTKLGVLIFVFFTGMVLGALQPALLYGGAETPEGTLWDPFVNVSLFTLTPTHSFKGPKLNLAGPLSISYEPDQNAPFCDNGQYHATMFYTLRLIVGKGRHQDIYCFDGATPGICLGDIGTPGSGGQGEVIMNFLKAVVLTLFPNPKDAQITSVDNAGIAPDSLAFVGDITIAVKQ